MKKLILILAVALLPFVATAQTDTTKAYSQHCLLTVTNKLLSKKVGVKLKFKQQANTTDLQVATDAQKITFATVVDALDYMAAHGWALVTAYSSTTDPTTTYYIMRRQVS